MRRLQVNDLPLRARPAATIGTTVPRMPLRNSMPSFVALTLGAYADAEEPADALARVLDAAAEAVAVASSIVARDTIPWHLPGV
jgi:hypothetical protein